MIVRILTLSALLVGSAGSAFAGVLPPITISEPMSLSLFGAGVGALYLIKKLRG